MRINDTQFNSITSFFLMNNSNNNTRANMNFISSVYKIEETYSQGVLSIDEVK